MNFPRKKYPFLSPFVGFLENWKTQFPFLFPVREITMGADPSLFM